MLFYAVMLITESSVFAQAPVFSLYQGFPSGQQSKGVAYGNSKYVSLSGSVVYHSSDGIKWERGVGFGVGINSITFGDGMFVVVGDDGYIAVSVDGLIWEAVSSGTTKGLSKIDFINGRFLVTGATILLTSDDGVGWSEIIVNGSAGSEFRNIAYGAGKYIIAYGNPSGILVYKSATGESNSWTSQQLTIPNGDNLNWIRFLKDRFYAFSAGSRVYTSTDGDVWTEASVTLPDNSITAFGSGMAAGARAGLYDGSHVYLFGWSDIDGGSGTVFKSADGLNFTLIPKTAEYDYPSGAAYFNGKYFAWGGDGIVYSTDGSTYYFPGGDFTAIATNGSKAVIVGAIGQNGAIFSSADLPELERVSPAGQRALADVVFDGSRFLAVGNRTIVESGDGQVWNGIGDNSNNFNGVAHGNGIFVAAGSDAVSSSPKIAYSSDGSVWTTANSDNNIYYKVKFVNGRFFALGFDQVEYEGVIYSSADGVSWANITPTNLSVTAFYYNDVTWDGTRYHFMGTEYLGPKANWDISFFTTSTSDPTSSASYSSKAVISNPPPGIALGGGTGEGAFEFIGGQFIGTTIDGNTSEVYVIYSIDGTSWTAVPTDVLGAFKGCLVDSGKLRFVGWGSQILTVTPAALNAAPTASDAEVSGTLVVGQTLTGSYSYSDPQNDTENGSAFVWYRADDNSGTGKVAIAGASGSSYELTADDLGKFISFKVIPKDGSLAGSPVESAFRGPIVPPPTTVASIVRASASPTNALTVNYTVKFSAGVTGVDATDFALTTTSGTASGTVGTPTGSGVTWTVPVTSLSGTGMLRLDFVQLTGINPNASAAFSSGEVYTIDCDAPDAPSVPDLVPASDSGISDADNVTNVTTVTFQGTAEAGASVSLYETDTMTILGTATADIHGKWSVISSVLSAGIYKIIARATDNAGNESPLSEYLKLEIDSTAPPAPIINAPAAGTTLNTAFPLFAGTAEANAKVAIYIDGVKVAFEHTDGSGSWKFQTNLPLSNGAHTVYAVASDHAGNVGLESSAISFAINAVPAVYVSGILQPFKTVYRKVSTYQKFSVSGSGLTAPIVISLPHGFEASTDNSTFDTTLTIGSSSNIGPIWVYLRLKGTVAAGRYAGSIHVRSIGVSEVVLPTADSNVVARAELTVKASAQKKEYDGTASAKVSLTDDRLPGDSLELSYRTAFFDNRNAGKDKKVTVDSIEVRGADAGNYNVNKKVTTTGEIIRKKLAIIAHSFEKLEGTENPELKVKYDGFIKGEDASVLTVLPSVSTTALRTSAAGKYPISVGGAKAQNYEISYVEGTLKVVTGAPVSFHLSAVPLFENRSVGTLAGEFSAKSADPKAEFTYALIAGEGDADNRYFSISGDRLTTAASLDFETQNSFKIRVRVSTNHGYTLEEIFKVVLKDVNEQPTIAELADVSVCPTTESQVIEVTGITAGPDAGQALSFTVSTPSSGLFEKLEISRNGRLTYRIKPGQTGSAPVTVLVQDNGGTDHGGVDTVSRTFLLTVNRAPDIVITSDIGASISKGETIRLIATGGTTYRWINPAGLIRGEQSDTLTVRPESSAVYRVKVTTAAGCEAEQEIAIVVKDDYQAINRTNIVTPNGDGVNDNFIIENLDMYPNNEVKIFDKAGRIIYRKVNYTNEWTGTLKGAPLAEGTYYYIVDFGERKPVLKGFITIVRD